MKPTRIGIYIDGAYFYYGYEECVNRYNVEIDIGKFLDYLKDKIYEKVSINSKNASIKFKRYYNGKVTHTKYKYIQKIENDFIDNKFDMKINDRVCFTDSSGKRKYKQSGVDVSLTIGIMNDIKSNKLDIVILCSSDRDFIPLFDFLKKNKIIVIILSFHCTENDRLKKSKLFSEADHRLYFFHPKRKENILEIFNKVS